jgi:hypothetical protein
MLARTHVAPALQLRWACAHSEPPPWLARSLDGPAPPGSSGPAVQVLIKPTLPTPGLCWLLTDGSGVPLHAEHPLIHAITGGHGIDLALWQREAPDAPWALLRRLHVAASARYGRGLRGLPGAVARLLQQTAADAQLPPALPARGSAGALAGTQPAPRAPATSAARRLAQRLRGLWVQESLQWRRRWLSEAWQIGIIDQPLEAWVLGSAMPAVRWLPSPPGDGYWADPMADGISPDHLLCEYFDETTGRGHIERLALQGGRVLERRVLPLGHGQHASFPLVQTIGGRRVGLVETAALGLCQLHEVRDDGSWWPIATLLDGVPVADPALFEWEGRFWLAYTDITLGALDNLCLLHAPALEGPWEPHANNPVKVDVTGARMAGGLFWHQGALYRPAQNCLQTYGASVVVQRVLHCSPTAYAEETVRELRPDPRGPCPDGMHTLSAWGPHTLVDGKRHVFSAHSVWMKLRRRWQQRRGTNGERAVVDVP